MEREKILEIAGEADISEEVRKRGHSKKYGTILSQSERDGVLSFMREKGVSERVLHHSLAVARLSLGIGMRIKSKGKDVDLEFLEKAALLHDIGRSRSHTLFHGLEGAKMLDDERLKRACEVHLFAGISAGEAKELGLPERDFIPGTIEEKIITYADNLVEGGEITDGSEKIARGVRRLGKDHPIVARMKKLASEIEGLLE